MKRPYQPMMDAITAFYLFFAVLAAFFVCTFCSAYFGLEAPFR